MLEIRPNCEHCNRDLLPNSREAMICSFECTFCIDCVEQVLENVCPNCGGGFEARPIRPLDFLGKYPPAKERTYKPVDFEKFTKRLAKLKSISPAER